MKLELLTPEEMAQVDKRAIAAGPFDGAALMARAGTAVAAATLERFAQAAGFDVLCGPGNNGGDGYVVARLLAERGLPVSVWALSQPRAGSDAESAALACPIEARPLAQFGATGDRVVIDALFGAGLSRALEGVAAACAQGVREAGCKVIAVDIPSGVSGLTGQPLGPAFSADLTVTFVRKKPGHLLQPGRRLCGALIVADIGIGDATVAQAGVSAFENAPALWRGAMPALALDTYKYRRGHVGVFSGGPSATGAARLSAMAAARIGAGAVTLLSRPEALQVNAMHLTAIMLRRIDGLEDAQAFIAERRPAALVFGPAFGTDDRAADFAAGLLDVLRDCETSVAFDADAITLYAARPDAFFKSVRKAKGLNAFATPHEGEFARLFPDLAADRVLSKLEKTRAAARRSGCTVIYKGPDTVIASPDGRTAINANGTPQLATAGSGDVLSGFVAGLAAQGMPPFEAACAAVWIHAAAAGVFGPGLIAEDLPLAAVSVLHDLYGGGADERNQ